MRRGSLSLAVVVPVVLAACGKGQLTVRAELEEPNPEGEGTVTNPLAGLEIRLLPYDRDVIFDSLAQAAPTPEPPIPDSILEAQQRVAEAQEAWRRAEAEWNDLRDRMKAISDEMKRYDRAERRYRELFREFTDLETRYRRVEREMNRAFARFDSLQKATIQQMEEIKLLRQEWADEAFRDVDLVIRARLRELGREEYADTTDAAGVAAFQVPPGRWWVYARYPLPFNELYWNVPVDLPRKQPQELVLNRENAKLRPNL